MSVRPCGVDKSIVKKSVKKCLQKEEFLIFIKVSVEYIICVEM